MEHDTIENLPDYLRDFEELKAICRRVDSGVSGLNNSVTAMLKKAWLSVPGCKRWEKLIERVAAGAEKEDIGVAMCFYQPVTTLEDLKGYIEAYMKPGKVSVEYDYDGMMVRVKSTNDNLVKENGYRIIRKIVPMNFDLIMEYVEELE